MAEVVARVIDEEGDDEAPRPQNEHHRKTHETVAEVEAKLRALVGQYADVARRDIARVTSGGLTSKLGLEHHFPTAHRDDLAKLEEMLLKNARYLENEAPSFGRFLAANCDPRTLQIDRKRELLRQFTLEDLCVLSLLSLALLLSTPARGHLNSLAGLIIRQDSASFNYSPTKHGEILFISSIATAVGRIFSGFIIDLHDPLHCFAIFSMLSATAVVFNSQLGKVTPGYDAESRYAVFVTLQTINVFFQAGIFASGVKFLHDHFRSAQYGRSLVIYAIGGRCGSILSGAVMGAVVSTDSLVWGDGVLISAILCFASIIPVMLIKRLPHPAGHLASASEGEFHAKKTTHEADAPPARLVHIGLPKCDTETRERKWKHLLEAIRRATSWWQRRSFVLMALANAGMAVAVSGEGFEGIMSLFTGRVLHVPPGLTSASVTLLSHIGALVSLSFGGLIVERLSRPTQARVILMMMSISCFAAIGLIGLAAQGQNHPPAFPNMDLAPGARAVYFFIGFGLGYPFFVTVQKFAMNFGGSHAALVSQTLGWFATAVCAIADGCFGAVAERSFAAVAVILTIFIFIGWVSMFLFDFAEWSAKVRLKNFDYKARVEKLLRPNKLADAEHDRERRALLLEHSSFSEDISTMLDKRRDATHRGLHILWSIFTFSLVSFVVVALFISYFWLKNPSSLFV